MKTLGNKEFEWSAMSISGPRYCEIVDDVTALCCKQSFHECNVMFRSCHKLFVTAELNERNLCLDHSVIHI